MRLLVLGGTVFVSHAVAAEAVARGHEVSCAARGRSGAVPAGARLVPVDRNAAQPWAPLVGERFDAVVDVATMSPPWVADALRALGPGAAHWTFVSSVGVYADTATPGQRTDAPLVAPRFDAPAELTNEAYGAAKAGSEQLVRDALGERAFVVHPGLIAGPGDGSDRYGYWPARLARGGAMAVPLDLDALVQLVDVRDLAGWIVDAGERRLTGTFDAVCPPLPLAELLARSALGSPHELVPVPADVLDAAGVTPWSGPRSLPLWLPANHAGFGAHDPTLSLAAGLRIRPLGDTARAALAHEQALGPDRERRAGLSAAAEAELLAGWHADGG